MSLLPAFRIYRNLRRIAHTAITSRIAILFTKSDSIASLALANLKSGPLPPSPIRVVLVFNDPFFVLIEHNMVAVSIALLAVSTYRLFCVWIAHNLSR